MGFFLQEARNEFRAGIKGGVLPLIYLVLTGYILLVMTSADNLRNMGAVDIPRNAPALVYLMTSGDSFFLFFAWAWVFAQPIVRDRQAMLHEVVLTAPRSLHVLLAARYAGALGVALLLGTSQILGFLAAPLLEWAGAVPAGSVAPTPWMAFGWASLVFTLPLAAGAGALYFVAALKTRSAGGPFAVAALLMACWMVAMIVFKEGHADPFLMTLLDPSGFAETEHQVVDHWTPHEKNTALLALTPALLWNRLIWGVLPLAVLAVGVWRTRRESLVLDKNERNGLKRSHTQAPKSRTQAQKGAVHVPLPSSAPASASWLRATLAESIWQGKRILSRPSLWAALALLTLLAVASGFAHGIQHAYGPMVARAEFISPVLTRTFYLIVAFMAAAMVGLVVRRDEQPGLSDMFDATPAPDAVRLVGRAIAALTVGVISVSVPALGATIAVALSAPQSSLILPLLHHLTVLLPAILELSAIVLLLHTLIRHPGVAHAAAILTAFIMVVNFEVGLVNYPPHQIGRGVDVSLSGLTGLTPWMEKILASDGFKLSLIVTLLALAAMTTRRGLDMGWRPFLRRAGQRALGAPGLVALGGLASAVAFSSWLHLGYVTEGGYETEEQHLIKDADWEKQWLHGQGGYALTGGEVALTIDPTKHELRGQWRIDGVWVNGTTLHAWLPQGFELQHVRVDGHPIQAQAENDHLAIPLDGGPAQPHTVELAWRLSANGWRTADHDTLAPPSWLVGQSHWLHALAVMPRLGLDSERVIRAPQDRRRLNLPDAITLPNPSAALASGAVAPAGRWQWRVAVEGQAAHAGGLLDGPLDFAALSAPQATHTQIEGVTLVHDASRHLTAQTIAQDLADMNACVMQRLGSSPSVTTVAQWPRGLPLGGNDAFLSANTLMLAEEPHWDVADQGTGRYVRRADLATALARRVITDATDLRESTGVRWIADGLPGAIGLICVAETNGLHALQALLSRGAQRTTEALASATSPVGALAQAKRGEWATEYAPLAALSWAIAQPAPKLQQLLHTVRQTGNVPQSLAAHFGNDASALWLGPPQAADLHAHNGEPTGERWVWREGGWQIATTAASPIALQSTSDHLTWQTKPPGSNAPSLYLDNWPAYEREPRDNWHAAN